MYLSSFSDCQNFALGLRNGNRAACTDHRVMDALRRLLSTKEAEELLEVIAESNSSFFSS